MSVNFMLVHANIGGITKLLKNGLGMGEGSLRTSHTSAYVDLLFGMLIKDGELMECKGCSTILILNEGQNSLALASS